MTIKLLEENIGRTLFDINHNNIFLDSLPGIMETKAKVKLNNNNKQMGPQASYKELATPRQSLPLVMPMLLIAFDLALKTSWSMLEFHHSSGELFNPGPLP